MNFKDFHESFKDHVINEVTYIYVQTNKINLIKSRAKDLWLLMVISKLFDL